MSCIYKTVGDSTCIDRNLSILALVIPQLRHPHPMFNSGPWAYRVNGLYVASSKYHNERPVYNMVREKEGTQVFLVYADDGYWRVISDDKDIGDTGETGGFARTEERNLTWPYDCAWRVRYNLLTESGMEPAPDLRVVTLTEDETAFREVRRIAL